MNVSHKLNKIFYMRIRRRIELVVLAGYYCYDDHDDEDDAYIKPPRGGEVVG